MELCKLTKAEKTELQALIDAADKARGDLESYLNTVAEDWEQLLDEKSEAWQDSEAGQQARERADYMRAWIDDLPDEISIDLDLVS